MEPPYPLIGWAELLKNENVNSSYIEEINNDIKRLETITERFSKIGSIPQLMPTDIVQATRNSVLYLEARSSKMISFHTKLLDGSVLIDLNAALYSWTIENLIKNSIDAMKGKGDLNILMEDTSHEVYILISDTGQGLSKKQFKTIFETGYTTKKRGWGLGLSLAKRIIEQYHGGKIKVLSSELGKGTTFQITLKKSI